MNIKFKNLIKNSVYLLVIVSFVLGPITPAFNVQIAKAAPNLQINYQGKITDTGGTAVSDGDYDMEFKLYTVATGGVAIWTETRTLTNQVTVTDGLFSVLLGEVTDISSVDFNQTLYLGVNFNSDGEMTPRKKLGSVPSAFESDKLDGLDSTQFIRSDATNSTSTTNTALILNQSGAGDILNLQDGGNEVFTVIDGGNVGIGTTTPYAMLSVAGEVVARNFVATSTDATSTLPTLSVQTAANLFGTYGTALSDFCTAITGSSGLCDGADATGAGFGQAWEIASGYLSPTTTITTLHNNGLIATGSSTITSLSVTNGTTTNSTSTSLNVSGNLTLGSDGLFTSIIGTGLQNSSNVLSFDCSEVEGTGINCTGEAITLDATGDWTGTFDGQEGSYYLSRANHTGTQEVSTLSNYDWTFDTTYSENSLTASSTIPLWLKDTLYASSTAFFTATSTFYNDLIVDGTTLFVDTYNNRVGIGTILPTATLDVSSGPIAVKAGASAASASLISGTTYGCTGCTYNNFLYLNDDTSNESAILNLGGGNAEFKVQRQGGDLFVVDGSDNGNNVGIGTSSPYAKLSVAGEIVGSYFTGTTTATSTFAGSLEIPQGKSLNFAGANLRLEAYGAFDNYLLLTGETATQKEIATPGAFRLEANTGLDLSGQWFPTILLAEDGSVEIENLAQGTEANRLLKIYMSAGARVYNGAFQVASSTSGVDPAFYASAETSKVGVGTSTPYSRLTVWGDTTDATTILEIVDSASTTVFSVSGNGTTTLTGALINSGTATSTFANGINLSGGCFAVSGTCVGGGSLFGQTWEISNGYLSPTTTITTLHNNGLIAQASSTILNLTSITATTTDLIVSGGYIDLSNAGVSPGTGQIGYESGTSAISIDNLSIADRIYHNGDSNTYIQFTNDQIQFIAGGSVFLNIDNTSQDQVTINEGSGDVDFRVESNDDQYAFFLESSTSNVGIGTSSPYAKLSVVGEIVGAYFTGTTTATSTFAGGIETNLLNVTSSSATSTFANGINLSGGCFAISGTCVDGGVVNSGTAGQIAYYASGGTTLSATSTLFIDTATAKIGIGTTSPDEALHLSGKNLLQSPYASSSRLLSTHNTGALTAPRIQVKGGYAYISHSSNTDNLIIIDVSDVNYPATTSVTDIGQNVDDLDIEGSYLYTVESGTDNDFTIFDISNPSSPVQVGVADSIASGTKRIDVVGKYAYITSSTDSYFGIFDVSDPRHPIEVASTTAVTDTQGEIQVDGKYAYIMSGDTSDSLLVYDVSNPSNPALVDTYAMVLSNQSAMKKSGDLIYILGYSTLYLEIVNASDPTNLVIESTTPISGSIKTAIEVEGRYAYTLDSSTGYLDMYDVASTTNVTHLSEIDLSGNLTSSIDVVGRYAYVVDQGTDSLRIVDIGGIEVTSALVHSLEAGSINVRDNISLAGDLSVTGGLNLGFDGLFSAGPVSINYASTTASSSYAKTALSVLGYTGIGTTTPYSKLSVWGDSADGATIFEIVDSASTTVFSVSGNGTTTLTGALINSGSATSTFANGINLSGGCFAVSEVCVGGDSFAWTPDTTYNENANSTSTPIWLKDTLYASSTSFFHDTLYVGGNAVGVIASTDDGSDTQSFSVGHESSSRGGSLTLVGNESPFGGAGGNVTLAGGNSTSGDGIVSILTTKSGAGITLTSEQGATDSVFTIDGQFLFDGGNVGIGTSTPYAKLSVVGETVAEYFTATSTTATSTFAWGIEANALNVTSSSATSTFANGINLSGGCFAVSQVCVGGDSFAWTTGTNYNETVNSTSTPIWLQDSLYASSTVFIHDNLTVDAGTLFVWAAQNSVGIGDTTPDALLDLFQSISADGTPHLQIENNSGVNGDTFISLLSGGSEHFSFGIEQTSGLGRFVISQSTDLNSNEWLTILADGKVGVGTSSPASKLTVWGTGTTDARLAEFVNSASTSVFSITEAGTTTLATALQIGTTTANNTWTLTVDGGICITGGTSCPAAESKGGLAVDTNAGTTLLGVPFDLAEVYPASEIMDPQDIASLDIASTSKAVVKKAVDGETAIGIVSTSPAIAMNGSFVQLGFGLVEPSTRPLIALAGRVPVKVSNESGDIKKGDRIALSSIPGVGRKADGTETQTVGIALESWSGGDGEIGSVLVYVDLDTRRPSESIIGDTIELSEGGAWVINQFGQIKAFTTIDLDGNDLVNIREIRSFTGDWQISEDGILQIREVYADKIDTQELCVDGICINRDEFKKLLETANISTAIDTIVDNVGEDALPTEEVTDPIPDEVVIDEQPVSEEPAVIDEVVDTGSANEVPVTEEVPPEVIVEEPAAETAPEPVPDPVDVVVEDPPVEPDPGPVADPAPEV